ncbi:MAG: hypothetical protein OXC92_08395 [Flavobacteriaceae bacterium]|nr:hypothetical protein [Flavobacteriaceae bacterium]MCY4216984.1 hypothetical protein [Flavobacteriaceae bacterium]
MTKENINNEPNFTFQKKEMGRIIRAAFWFILGLPFIIVIFIEEVNPLAKILGVILFVIIAVTLTPILNRKLGMAEKTKDEKVQVAEKTNFLLIFIALSIWFLIVYVTSIGSYF